MNGSSHKVIFSKVHNALVAVGENATANGKGASGEGVRTRLAAQSPGTAGPKSRMVQPLRKVCVGMGLMGMGSMYLGSAHASLVGNALPGGGVVSTGSATIATSGNTMAIHQGTDRASINWSSFNVGSAASVNIVQPGSTSVLLNRVVGPDPSQIMGSIRANGQVMLVNPNGVVFGKGGSVTATSFTASTMGISDADFQAGNHRFGRNGSGADVVNQGTITANGGYVALLGASVSNEGKIVTRGGDVVMASGESATISIPVSRGGKVRLVMNAADINTAVANKAGGIIQTEGGQVLMQAASVGDALAHIHHSGSIDTSGAQGGEVTLRADHGNITVSGSIHANSTDAANKAGGSIVIGRTDDDNGKLVLASATDVSGARLESKGGFVETSGEQLKTDGVAVKAKDWLLDPANITIVSDTTANSNWTNTSGTITPNSGAATSNVRASTIATALGNGTNVTVTTTNTGTSGAADGNISISTGITATNNTNTDATLTLIADNSILGSSSITGNTATGKTGLINLVMIAKGTPQTAGNNGGVIMSSAINTTGDVTLTGTNSGTQAGITRLGVRTNGITARSIAISGISSAATGLGDGVLIAGDLTARGGDITVYGESRAQHGVQITGGTISAISGNIKISGLATSSGNGTSGVYISNTVGSSTFTTQNLTIGDASLTTAKVVTGLLRNNVAIGRPFNPAITDTTVTTVTTTGSTGTTIVGSVTQGNNGSGVSIVRPLTTSGALNITGTATDTASSGVSVANTAVVSTSGSNSSIILSGNVANANSTAHATSISGNVQGLNGAAVTVRGTTNGRGSAVLTPPDTAGTANTTGNIGDIGGLTAGAVTVSGTITNAASSAHAVSLRGITTSANTISITGTTNGTGSGVALLTDSVSTAAQTSWVKTWNNSTWTAAGLAGTNTITVRGTNTGTSGAGVLISGQSIGNANGNTLVVGSGTGSGVSLTSAMLTAKSLGSQTVAVNGNLTGNTASTATTTAAGVTFGAGSGVDSNTLSIVGETTAVSNTTLNYGVSLQGSFTTTQNSSITGTTNSTLTPASRTDTNYTAGVWFSGATSLVTANGTSVVTASGTTLTVKGTSPNGNGVFAGNITGGVGDAGTLALNGTTLYSGSDNLAIAGVKIVGSVVARNISVTGLGSSTVSGASSLGNLVSASTVGSLTDTDTVSFNGTSSNSNNGSYIFSGTILAKGNISMNGVNTNDKSALALAGTSRVVSASGSINLVGTNSQPTNSIYLDAGTSVTASSGAGVTMTANGGGILAVPGTGVTITNGTTGATNGGGSIDLRIANNQPDSTSRINLGNASLVQNGNGGISVTSDYGDISVRTIANRGTGDVVLAAGSKAAAGVGSGGNVSVVSGGSLSNNGGLYIYTGSYSSFGDIKAQWNNLTSGGSGFSGLYYNGSSRTRNVGFGSGFSSSNAALTNGSNSQVVFRENKTPTAFNLNLANTQAVYGAEAFPLSQATELARLKGTWGGDSMLSQTDGANTFSLASAEALNALRVNRTPGAKSTAGYEVANTGGYAYNATMDDSAGLNTTVANGANLVHVIQKARATVTANSGSLTYNGYTQHITGFSATGLLSGDTPADLTGVTMTGSAKNAGSWGTAASGSDNNYELTFNPGTLVIGKAAATVTANSASLTYNGVTQSVTGFQVSGLVGSDTASVLTGVQATGASGKDAGTRINIASGSDNNYDLTFNPGTLVIGKAAATVTANSGSLTYNGANQSVAGFFATGLLGSDTAASLTGVAITSSAKNVGTWTNAASGSDHNYDLRFIPGTMVIGKAAATVTANSANLTYNGATQSVTGFFATGLQGDDTTSALTGVQATGASGKNPGRWRTTVSGSDNNYDLTFLPGSLVIGKAHATVTANSADVTYNGRVHRLSGFTATGLVGGETESVLTGVSAQVSGVAIGVWKSIAKGSDNNYELAFVEGHLKILPPTQMGAISASKTTESVVSSCVRSTFGQATQVGGLPGFRLVSLEGGSRVLFGVSNTPRNTISSMRLSATSSTGTECSAG